MTVGSLKTNLVKICQLELFIADKYTPYLGQRSPAFRSRTKQHKRAVNELSNDAALYGLVGWKTRNSEFGIRNSEFGILFKKNKKIN